MKQQYCKGTNSIDRPIKKKRGSTKSCKCDGNLRDTIKRVCLSHSEVNKNTYRSIRIVEYSNWNFSVEQNYLDFFSFFQNVKVSGKN